MRSYGTRKILKLIIIQSSFDHNLDFITYEEFKTRYQLKTNFFTYYVSINSPEYYYNKWKHLIEKKFVR